MFKSRLLISALIVMAPIAADAALFGDDQSVCVNASGASYETAFSNNKSMAPTVVSEIASAKKSIRVAARHFNSKSVSIALVQAARGGKDLKIVLDEKLNNNDYSSAAFLRSMSMPPHVLKHYDNMYLDFIVIDENDVVLGNIAGLADADAEKKNPSSVLVMHNVPELAKQYLANWNTMWDSSEEMKKAKSGGLHDQM
jgi:hypothetical protein